jgi:UDP-3-O-[3-hydroxymyristoyl] glucosamine N-acyltransferase
VPQVGTVEIEKGAWIGSNVTIDRATIGVTRIRRGARVENLSQIGHNVEVGENTVIRPQVGVAGSTRIGAESYVGEKSGINGHIEIGNDVTIFPFSGIPKGLADGANVMGAPARPVEIEESLQQLVKDLPDIVKDIKRLRQKMVEEKK